MSAMDAEVTWDQLLELVTRLDAGEATEAAVRFGDVSVQLSKGGALSTLDAAAPASASAPVAAPPPAVAPAPAGAPAAPAAASAEQQGTAVTAPIVGILYRAPAPGADPFVVEGDEITADQTIAIIEVMKMMNPVTAGVAGRLRSFAVADGEAVEFGQPIAHVDVSA